MANEASKFRKRVDEHGFIGAVRLSIRKSFTGRRRKAILSLDSPEQRFTKIYNSNHWNSAESRSGEGSTLENTAVLRAALPVLFERHGIKRFLDVPCGDFNWMQAVVEETDIDYIGGDIVRSLVEKNEQEFGSVRVRFQHLDLTSDPLPQADILMCRDCLIHLSFSDISKVLQNFLRSDVRYFFVSSNGGPEESTPENRDIPTGDMRPLRLFSHPLNASERVLEIIADPVASRNRERYMVLMHRDHVQQMLDSLVKSKSLQE